MDKVMHFEIPVDNMARAKKFYKETFEWQIEDVPEMDYVMVRTVEVDEKRMPKEVGAINGGMLKRTDMDNLVDAPSFAVTVDNIDEAIKKIKNAGGLIMREKTAVGNMGVIAYFKDPEGNILSVWQSTRKHGDM